MSWRQQNDSINQISKLRLENTRYKIQLQKIKKEWQPRSHQLLKLQQQLLSYRQRQHKTKSFLIRIGVLLNHAQLTNNENIYEGFEIFQNYVIEIKERLNKCEKEMEKMRKGVGEGIGVSEKLQVREKELDVLRKKYQHKEEENRHLTERVNSFNRQIDQLKQQLEKKDNLLADMSLKLTQYEIDKKQLQAEIASPRNLNPAHQNIKREWQQLLGHIIIKDDDYLKSYLLKNQRYQHSNTSISRRTKYDFIFQD